MAHGVTSEWEDIHVRIGNYEAREKEVTQAELTKQAIDHVEQQDPLARKNIEELKEMEDDFEDDFLEQYKKKRLDQIKSQAGKPRYGESREISKQDYVHEVTNAPKDVFVILHLHQDYVEVSSRLDMIFQQLAKNYEFHKFLRIRADRCIENFPDAKVPSIIVYYNSELKSNIVRLDKELPSITYGNVEGFFKKIGVFEKGEDDNQDDQDYGKFLLRRNVVDRDADRSDSDEDDREYIRTTFKKI